MKLSPFQLLFFFLIPLLCPPSVHAQTGLSPIQIDSLVEETRQVFNIPGIAVAVLKDGQEIVKKGYGIRSIATHEKVDTQTIFGIASNTKAFTSAALAQLIDQGKIDWDTKVEDVLPEFKLYDPYVTREFTIRDLLTHRSGLGLGAGDLMLWPTSNTTTMQELIHNLRYLKPVSSFRTKYDYDNLLYIVAGEVIARVSGKTYEEYLEQNIFKPLKMDRANLNLEVLKADPNRIYGHTQVGGKLKVLQHNPYSDITKAAGGIFASIDDMSKWVQARLNMGKYGPELQDSLFSVKQAKEMWAPQTIIPSGKDEYNTHFKAYGLGWRLQDAAGYLQVWHTGGLGGIVSKVMLVPELNLGIVVLTNQEVGAAYEAIINSILDAYFGVQGKNRIQQYQTARQQSFANAHRIVRQVDQVLKQNDPGAGLKSAQILGRYKDAWFGEVILTEEKDGQLYFSAIKSPDLSGPLQFYKGNTYVIKWNDPTIDANAYVLFSLDENGRAEGFKMKAISPLTDFSYDFQDLDFKRLN